MKVQNIQPKVEKEKQRVEMLNHYLAHLKLL